ncbi:30S ribosomal protein S12 [Candidatus Hodgkinia cicadicola]|uniref:30S ribosomal protein S12 n=1 Tax=Candidatus Hodgkinia cicadicola TaxID=573658 RepID=A0ABX4MF91_9HYPH|nr:30S ribosomal protein S12 [Candidatus Hodgkinia cicadicola]
MKKNNTLALNSVLLRSEIYTCIHVTISQKLILILMEVVEIKLCGGNEVMTYMPKKECVTYNNIQYRSFRGEYVWRIYQGLDTTWLDGLLDLECIERVTNLRSKHREEADDNIDKNLQRWTPNFQSINQFCVNHPVFIKSKYQTYIIPTSLYPIWLKLLKKINIIPNN